MTNDPRSDNAFERDKPGTAARSRAESAIEQLRQRGGVFVDAVRATRMPMVLTDPSLPGNPIVFANQSFLNLSGYGMDQVLGQQPYFMNGPGTDPNDAEQFRQILETDQDGVVETVQYAKNGRRFVATVLLSAFKDDDGKTLHHFLSWADVTRRVDAEGEIADLRATQSVLSQNLRDTNTLQDLSALMVSEDNIQTIYEEILSAAIDITQAKAGTVQMLDPETEDLVVLATRGFSRRTRDHFHRIDARSNTSCGLALRSGDRAYFNFDPASTDKAARLHAGDGVLSAQSTPLRTRSGRPIGMVSTHWGDLDHRPSDRELRFLDLLARQAADVLEQRATARALHDREQRAQTLLAELQHRVRNTLAVVRSIVRRTAAGSDSVEDFERHLDGRLSAFARTQAYVTGDPGGGIDLELIVRDELLAHASEGDQHISIVGPAVRLSTKQAETLGMAIHELTTNAIKHGALTSDGNKVEVGWFVEGEGNERKLHFSWIESLGDRGLGEPKRNGFGTELLDRVMRYELDAEPEIEFNPGGLSYKVAIPLSVGAPTP